MTIQTPERNVSNHRALIIFAKNPTPGSVKTRLSPPLKPEDAATLYACMLEDTLRTALHLDGVTPIIFFQDGNGAHEYFTNLAPNIAAIPQMGKDLGERMGNAFQQVFANGFKAAAIIGTDSPDLPAELIMKAFELLKDEDSDLVLGPAEDGGYYLLAMKKLWDALFTSLPWSTGELLHKSVERAKDLCLRTSLLPTWYDIDTEEDLKRPELHVENCIAVKTKDFLTSRRQLDNPPLSDN